MLYSEVTQKLAWSNCDYTWKNLQWVPSRKARNVSLKLQNLIDCHAPFFPIMFILPLITGHLLWEATIVGGFTEGSTVYDTIVWCLTHLANEMANTWQWASWTQDLFCSQLALVVWNYRFSVCVTAAYFKTWCNLLLIWYTTGYAIRLTSAVCVYQGNKKKCFRIPSAICYCAYIKSTKTNGFGVNISRRRFNVDFWIVN